MPDVTAGSDGGVLAAWLVEEAARFDAAQTIAYVETEDELFSVEAGRPGLLLKILVEPGTSVASGTPIGILGEPWEQVHDLEATIAELGVVPSARVTAPSWFDGSVSGRPTDPSPQPSPQPSPVTPLVPELTVIAELIPLERRRGTHAAVVEPDPLEQLGIEPDPLEHVGVEPVASKVSGDEPRATPERTPDQTELHHHYLRARVRVDRLVALSAELERDRPDAGVTDLVNRAILAAHRQVPQLATAHTGDGRVAGIPVSHPGRFGVEEAVVVVPTGHSAALAVGAVSSEPVIDGGAVIPGRLITLTLSVRPGRVDDVQASRWLAVLVALLERPEWLRD
jgi:pyruvate dehydrogenase E2 component (dihydrolipoamide acetyltransferase)